MSWEYIIRYPRDNDGVAKSTNSNKNAFVQVKGEQKTEREPVGKL
jgi:hypothetical protein